MRPYLAVLSARFRTLLQYRAAAAAGFATQLFWGLIRVMIFTAFYASAPPGAIQPMSLAETISYLWLTQALFALAFWNVDQDVKQMVTTGTVAYELLRPTDLYGLWFARSLAARAAPTLLRAGPIFIIAGLFFGLKPPPSLASASACGVALFGAMLLASALSTIVTISLLYTVGGEGIQRLTPLLMLVFSGMLIPLPLLPAAWKPLFDFLPFRGVLDTPFRLYTGNLLAENAAWPLLHQGVWIVVLIVLGRVLLARATRQMVVQGG